VGKMAKRLLVLSAFLLVATVAFSQQVIRSNLDYMENGTTQDFNYYRTDQRGVLRAQGMMELDQQPNYVWGDISRH